MISLKKIADLFGGPACQEKILQLERQKLIPPAHRERGAHKGAKAKLKQWKASELGAIGQRCGFFPPFKESVAMAVFTTKGGVLKSTLSLNLARVAALHGHRVCVVGLDMQGDVTTSLGHERHLEEEFQREGHAEEIEELIERLDATLGLADFFMGQASLEEIIKGTDLPNLFLIPETPELVACNESLSTINRREYWLKDKVVAPLKQVFDLIIMDCSPNWNKLTTNALVACDLLISPLECKINNFRNFKVFRHFLEEFRQDMQLAVPAFFVPTKFATNKKLTMEIKDWYQSHVEGCTHSGVRESSLGEEATALNLSMVEHGPTKPAGKEMRELLTELHGLIEGKLLKEPLGQLVH